MKNLRLKSARAALDMSQQQLADAVGVSRQTINAMEKMDELIRGVHDIFPDEE